MILLMLTKNPFGLIAPHTVFKKHQEWDKQFRSLRVIGRFDWNEIRPASSVF